MMNKDFVTRFQLEGILSGWIKSEQMAFNDLRGVHWTSWLQKWVEERLRLSFKQVSVC